MDETSSGRKERRSTRVEVEIPIIISSVKTQGGPYEGPGVTILVNKHGAKILTAVKFKGGDYVRLTIPATNHSQLARVAWVDDKDNGLARLAFGIALEEPENFWGVYFPPDDWEESPSWEDWGESEAERSFPPAPHPRTSTTPHPKLSTTEGAVATSPSPTELAAVEIFEEGTPVFVRGISAAYLPFQEQTWLQPVGGQEATIRLRAIVDVGKLVQVIFPPDKHILRARTTGVSDHAREGKWKLWLRLGATIRIIPKAQSK